MYLETVRKEGMEVPCYNENKSIINDSRCIFDSDEARVMILLFVIIGFFVAVIFLIFGET